MILFRLFQNCDLFCTCAGVVSTGAWNQYFRLKKTNSWDPNIFPCPEWPQLCSRSEWQEQKLAEDESVEYLSSRWQRYDHQGDDHHQGGKGWSSRCRSSSRQELGNAADLGAEHKRAILGEWDSLDCTDSWYRVAFLLTLSPYLRIWLCAHWNRSF